MFDAFTTHICVCMNNLCNLFHRPNGKRAFKAIVVANHRAGRKKRHLIKMSIIHNVCAFSIIARMCFCCICQHTHNTMRSARRHTRANIDEAATIDATRSASVAFAFRGHFFFRVVCCPTPRRSRPTTTNRAKDAFYYNNSMRDRGRAAVVV